MTVSQLIGYLLSEYWGELFGLCIVFLFIWVVDQLYQLDGDMPAEHFRDEELE